MTTLLEISDSDQLGLEDFSGQYKQDFFPTEKQDRYFLFPVEKRYIL